MNAETLDLLAKMHKHVKTSHQVQADEGEEPEDVVETDADGEYDEDMADYDKEVTVNLPGDSEVEALFDTRPVAETNLL